MTGSAISDPNGQFIALALLFAIPIFVIYWGQRNPGLTKICLLAWAMRATAALIHYYVFALPDSQQDALVYFNDAEALANGVISFSQHFQQGPPLYSSFLGTIFLLTGPNELAGQAFNVLFGVLAVGFIYKTTLILFDRRSATAAGLAAAFWPSLILYSSLTHREAPIYFFTAAGIFLLVRFFERERASDLVGGGLFSVAAMLVHSGMVGLLLAGVLMFSGRFFAHLMALHRSLKIAYFLPLVLITVGGLAVVVSTGAGMQKFGSLTAKMALSEAVSTEIKNRATSRAAYLQDLTISSPTDLVTQAPIRVIYFLFSPFPWKISTPADALGSVDGILYGICVAGLVFFLSHKENRGRPSVRFLMIAGIVTVGLFAFGTSNSGAAVRHRAKLTPIILVLAAPGLVRKLPRSRSVNPSASIV